MRGPELMSLIVLELVLVFDNIFAKTSLRPIKIDLCTSKRVSFSSFAETNNVIFLKAKNILFYVGSTCLVYTSVLNKTHLVYPFGHHWYPSCTAQCIPPSTAIHGLYTTSVLWVPSVTSIHSFHHLAYFHNKSMSN